MGEVTEAATKLGIRAIEEFATTRDDFAAAFDAIIRDNCRALLVPGDAVARVSCCVVTTDFIGAHGYLLCSVGDRRHGSVRK
jgi:hypothetical protein